MVRYSKVFEWRVLYMFIMKKSAYALMAIILVVLIVLCSNEKRDNLDVSVALNGGKPINVDISVTNSGNTFQRFNMMDGCPDCILEYKDNSKLTHLVGNKTVRSDFTMTPGSGYVWRGVLPCSGCFRVGLLTKRETIWNSRSLDKLLSPIVGVFGLDVFMRLKGEDVEILFWSDWVDCRGRVSPIRIDSDSAESLAK